MQQIKTYRPLRWMVPLITASILFCGCPGPSTTEEVTADSTDSGSTMMAPADTTKAMDSLPPVDTTVVKKPEPRKNP